MKTQLPTTILAPLVFILVAAALPLRASAASSAYNLQINGALLNRFGGTCADALGDTYDNFCPNKACSCLQYDDPDKNKFSGNVVGSKSKGGFITVHFTFNAGSHTGVNGTGLGCAPAFGEIQLTGTKDNETIFFAGSLCDVQTNPNAAGAVQKMAGGWSLNSSSHGFNAFGTFTGNFQFNKIGFNMSLKGQKH